MIQGTLAMLVANGASLLAARGILRRLDLERGPQDLALFMLVRIALISGTVLGAGVFGVLTPSFLGALGAVVLLGFLLRDGWPLGRGLRLPEVNRVDLALAFLLLARVLVQVWLFSPHLTDVLSYHLPKVAEWVRAGRFTSELGLDNHVTFPAGFELLETWWVVFLHHDVLIEMAGVEFLLLAFAATYGLARRLGLSERSSFLAALLYASTPALSLQSVACMNDTPVAAIVVTTFMLVAWRMPLAVLFLAGGLGMGVKATYLYAVPGFLVFWWLFREEPKSPAGRRGIAAGLAVLGLGIGLFWYGRNLVWFGNPFYPIGTSGLVDETGHRWIQAGPNLRGFLANLKDFVNVRCFDPRPYASLCEGSLGWGGVAFCGGILALPSAAGFNRLFGRLLAAAIPSFLSVLLLVQHDPWCGRFVLFFPSILSIGCVIFLDRFPHIFVAVGTAFLLQFLGSLVPGELSPQSVSHLWHQSWRERTIEEIAPKDASVIAYFGGNDGEPYLLYRPDYSREVRYLRATSGEELMSALDRDQVGYLYAVPSTFLQRRALSSAIASGRLLRLKDDVYRVKSRTDR